MPKIRDRLRKWLGPKSPPPTPGLYSPPERGAPDPDPSSFNVGDPVRAAGTAQSGAPAVADTRRRPLSVPVLVPDGTMGVVRGVATEIIQVAITDSWRIGGWQSNDDPEPQVGQRVFAVGTQATVDGRWQVPPKTLGEIKAVGDDTLDIEVVFQFRKEDWWNAREPGSNHWGMVVVTAAGLVDLKGLDTDIASAVAQATRDALNMFGEIVPGQVDQIRQIVAMSLDLLDDPIQLNDLLDGASVLSVPAADMLFRNVHFRLAVGASAGARAQLDVHAGGTWAQITINLAKILWRLDSSTPSSGVVLRAVESTVAHELRHAADWAYKEAGRPGAFIDHNTQPQHVSGPDVEWRAYINRPTELLSWAGDVAQKVWAEFGAEATSLTGTELSSFLQAKASQVMNALEPGNRVKFLQRVVQDVARLVAQRGGGRTGMLEVVGSTTQHYLPDMAAAARLIEQYSGAAQRAEYARYDVVPHAAYRVVPIADIKDYRIQHVDRYDRALTAMRANAALPPVMLVQDAAGDLWVEDGQHRILASTARGYRHVPAIVRWESPTRSAAAVGDIIDLNVDDVWFRRSTQRERDLAYDEVTEDNWRQYDLTDPIEVIEQGGKYWLEDGHHRWVAATQFADLDTLPARVIMVSSSRQAAYHIKLWVTASGDEIELPASMSHARWADDSDEVSEAEYVAAGHDAARALINKGWIRVYGDSLHYARQHADPDIVQSVLREISRHVTPGHWIRVGLEGERSTGVQVIGPGHVGNPRRASDEPAVAKTTWRGLNLHIEHLAGDVRHPEGPFPSAVGWHYGYIVDTTATDGDSVDVILGEHPESDVVYLAVQRDAHTGEFSQFKVLLDFDDKANAEAAMRLMWPAFMVGDIVTTPADSFVEAVLPKLDVTASALRQPRHAHSYPWGGRHAEVNDHSNDDPEPEPEPEPATPALQGHPHADGALPPGAVVNDQAVAKGETAGAYYNEVAGQYGTLSPGHESNLMHYDYRPVADKVNDLVKRYGYDVYVAGGTYGKPDLAKRNYNTNDLMIYDPTPELGGDFGDEEYTRTWRTIHELAHALSYKALNKKYGEGRRIGKLGYQRTLREAKRAVEWEWMAAHKQRQLGHEIGYDVDDATFAKELNTVMHDAIHRAVTGKFTNPDQEGFEPSDKPVPLETALATLEQAATNLGLTDEDSVLTPEQKRRLRGMLTVRAATSLLSITIRDIHR